jgi:hypothetical protein
VRVDRVLSSPWCRCLDTARLLAVGPVETSRTLIPMPPRAPGRLHALQELVAAWRGPGTLVLVTHGLTVQALLGFLPTQGATVVLKPGSGNAAPAELVGLIAGSQEQGVPSRSSGCTSRAAHRGVRCPESGTNPQGRWCGREAVAYAS